MAIVTTISDNTSTNRFKSKEWEKKVDPFQIAPHVYYVGTRYVGTYLLNTEKGLVLIDQGFAETVYLTFEGIRKVGFNPEDIKYLLVSHGHFDHCGGTRIIQEYCGAKIYMSKEDWEMLQHHPEWVYFDYQNWCDFTPDEFYADDKVLDFGDIKINTLLTPGHTPGTTSFFFEDYDSEGRRYKVAMHGGVGINTLTSDFYQKTPGWPENLPQLFYDNMVQMRDIDLDIPLPSHPMHIPIFDKAGQYKEGPDNPFINPQGWRDMVDKRIEQVLPILGK